jgi:hypothetical protein
VLFAPSRDTFLVEGIDPHPPHRVRGSYIRTGVEMLYKGLTGGF